MKRVAVLFVLIGLLTGVIAQEEVYLERLEGGAIVTGVGVLELKDGRYNDLGSGDFQTATTRNAVILSIEEGLIWDNLSAYEIEIDFELTGYNSTGAPISMGTHLLGVTYDPTGASSGSTEHRRAYTNITGYPWISIDISAIRVDGVPVSQAPGNVTLELEIATERYYTFDPDLIPGVIPHTMGASWLDEGGLHQEDALLIYWDYIQGALEYDLEWSYVDAFDGAGNLISPSMVMFSEKVFSSNSTRIRTREQSYRIENTFEKGYLVYRLRAIGKNGNTPTANYFGKWSTSLAQGGTSLSHFPHYVTLGNGHENNKNWQYSVVYAEGGKKKDIISYFDGSLRNRQTVTLLNTQGEAVVGETVYDGIGRSTVQVLPVPAGAGRLQYYENFNPSETNSSQAYSYKDFDLEPVVGLNSCQSPTVGELSTTSGAGRYYSPSADLRSKSHDYIPDAQGYAFTQVEYTSDNTGRVKRQSGVGGDFTLVGDHATEYFYGKPTQEELDRLFGADVGYNQHYKKNMVIDPNGQVSVTYVDAHGRTIATALSGTSPPNMDGLRNDQGDLLSSANVLVIDELSKIDKNGNGQTTDEPDNDEDDNQLTSSGNYIYDDILQLASSVIVVEDNPDFSFTYNITAPGYTDDCLNTNTYPYIYDLSISMISDCGEDLLNFPSRTIGPDDMNLVTGNYGTAPTYKQFDETDGLLIDYNGGTITAPAGTYHIAKQLQVNEAAVEHFADLYVEHGQANGCIMELQDFITANEAEIPISGCDLNCESCHTSLGTKGEYVQQMFAADNIDVVLDGNGNVIVPIGEESRNSEFEEEYLLLQKECDNLCGLNQNNLCTSLFTQMLNDVKPYGQYGAVTGNMSLSVFKISNSLLSSVNWKNPSSPYVDESGQDAWVYIHQNTDGSYEPQVDNVGGLLVNEEGVFSRPDNVKYLTDFLDVWQDSWAGSLVEAHPEYCYYNWCISDQSGGYGQTITVGNDALTSQEVDNIIMSIPTYSEAITGNYLNGIDLFDFSDLMSVDAFFSVNTDLSSALNNYHTFSNSVVLDILEFAIFINTEGMSQGVLPSASPGYYTWSFVQSNYAHQQDAIWNFYKGLLLAAKQKLLKPLSHDYALDNGCFNGCFGTELGMNTFNPFINAFWTFTGAFPSIIFNMALMPQPCDAFRFYQYKNKRPVWFPGNMEEMPEGDAETYISNTTTETYNSIYEQTGSCPLAFELKNLLNAVINDPLLSATQLVTRDNDLIGKPYFSNLLQNTFGVVPVAPTGVYIYDAVINSSTTLVIELGDIMSPCETELILPNYPFSGNNLNWNDYMSTWRIHSFGTPYLTQVISGDYHFSIVAYVDRDLNDPSNSYDKVVLSGSTCLMIGNCESASPETPGSVTSNCRLNRLGKGLQELLIQIHGTVPGGLEPTSPPYALSSDNFLYNELLNHYSSGVWTLSMEPSYPDSRIYVLKNGLHTLKIVTHNWPISPASVTGIQRITPWINNNFHFYVTNHVPATDWDPSMSYSLNGGLLYQYDGADVNKPSIAYCGPCEGPEFDITNAFREHLVSAINEQGTLIPDEFYRYFGTSTIAVTSVQTIEGGTSVYYLIDTATDDTLCEVQAQVIGDPGDSEVSSIGELLPYNGFSGLYGFQLDVQFENGSWVRLLGGTSCIPIAACPCKVEPAPPITCETAYEAYIAKMTFLGGVYSTNQLTYGAFCEGNYLNHIEDYLGLLEMYYQKYGSGMEYITLDEYIDCRMTDYFGADLQESWEQYNNRLAVLGLHRVSFSDYQEVGNCSYCLNLYEDYLATAPIEPKSLIDVCGYTKHCPGLPADIAPPIVIDPSDNYDCLDYLYELAAENAQYEYQQYIRDLREEFIANYVRGAMSEVIENFTSERPDNEYHYTLYYYDQAGNLVRTVPPKGVKRMDTDAGWSATRVNISNARFNYNPQTGYSAGVIPQHELSTTYAYNALNQLVWQHTPDGGESRFWYDALGRIVASQNARQQVGHLFSYTKFDAQGRVIEAGQLQGNSGDVVAGELQVDVNDATYPDNWTMNRTEVTRTIYDGTLIASSSSGLNFRNRIGSVIQQETLDTDLVFRSAYHYEYDMHGNVSHMQQDFRTNPSISGSGISATMDYEYDLISGNVKQVKYKTPSQKDLFYHRYYYDADNRITEVETSRDGYFWNTDAEYIYFDHGPLARVEIANDKVQGIDYAYTVQGWLKGVNAAMLDETRDMGADGKDELNNSNVYTARDAFGFALTYYDEDYIQIRTASSPGMLGDLTLSRPVGVSGLYNGNIAQMATALMDESENKIPLLAAEYSYDQLNRIKSMSGYLSGIGTGYTYATATGGGYSSGYQYDANGNLKALARTNSTGTLIDNFTYHYNANTNQLNYVSDPAGSLGDDLDNQSLDNYTYDAIGQLVSDEQEEIEEIVWTVTGKVAEIRRKATSTKPDLFFTYDPLGNRISKLEKPRDGSGHVFPNGWKQTVYMRDAQGNAMGTYLMKYEIRGGNAAEMYYIIEQNLYGSTRLGMLKREEQIAEREYFGYYGGDPVGEDPSSTVSTSYEAWNGVPIETRGAKFFELSNHLGNVLSVVTDRKLPVGERSTIYANDFNSDIEGVNAYQGGSVSHSGTRLSVTATSQGSGAVLQYVATVPGQTYRLQLTADLAGQGSVAITAYDVPTATVTAQKVMSSNGVHYLDFLASSSTTQLRMQSQVSGTRTFYIDDLTLEKRPSVFARDLTASYADIQTYGTGVTASISGNRLRVDNLGQWNGILCVFPTVAGRTYTVHYTLGLDGGPKLTPFVRNNITSANIQVQHITSDGRYTLTFVAPSSETMFAVENPNTGTRSMYLSYLFVQDVNAEVTDDFYYVADVKSYSDYYPFGMQIPGRHESSGEYRYGFQGQEKDDEIKGDGNSVNYKYRIHDPRVGRFFAVDPKQKEYPWNSPYAFSENVVINAIELEGLEKVAIIGGADVFMEGTHSRTMEGIKRDIEVHAKSENLSLKIRVFNQNAYDPGITANDVYNFIMENYDENEPLIVYGYSMGGKNAQKIVERLKEDGINVNLLVLVDASINMRLDIPIPENVDEVFNMYQTERNELNSKGAPVKPAEGNNRTEIYNDNWDKKKSAKGLRAHGKLDEDTSHKAADLIMDAVSGKKVSESNKVGAVKP